MGECMTSQSVLNMWTIDTSVMGNILRIIKGASTLTGRARACNPHIDCKIQMRPPDILFLDIGM